MQTSPAQVSQQAVYFFVKVQGEGRSPPEGFFSVPASSFRSCGRAAGLSVVVLSFRCPYDTTQFRRSQPLFYIFMFCTNCCSICVQYEQYSVFLAPTSPKAEGQHDGNQARDAQNAARAFICPCTVKDTAEAEESNAGQSRPASEGKRIGRHHDASPRRLSPLRSCSPLCPKSKAYSQQDSIRPPLVSLYNSIYVLLYAMNKNVCNLSYCIQYYEMYAI